MSGRNLTRIEADNLVSNLRGVWATAFSTKKSAGQDTQVPCFTVYVSHKLKRSTLQDESQIVPSSITIDGITYPTDVVRRGRNLVNQMLSPHTLSDGPNKGTLSFFCQDDYDHTFAATCAHCAAGSDGDPTTETNLIYKSQGDLYFSSLGYSVLNPFHYSGTGVTPEYGFADATMVSVENENLMDQIWDKASSVSAYPTPKTENDKFSLQGMKVEGESIYGNTYQGIVESVQFHNTHVNLWCDVSIVSPNDENLTRYGDSGMCWYTTEGDILALHAKAKLKNGLDVAEVCYGMFVDRILKHYSVRAFIF